MCGGVPSLSSCPSGKMAAEKPDLCHPQATSLRHLFFVGRHAPLGSGTVGRLQAVAVIRFAQEGPYVVGSRREVAGCARGRVIRGVKRRGRCHTALVAAVVRGLSDGLNALNASSP